MSAGQPSGPRTFSPTELGRTAAAAIVEGILPVPNGRRCVAPTDSSSGPYAPVLPPPGPCPANGKVGEGCRRRTMLSQTCARDRKRDGRARRKNKTIQLYYIVDAVICGVDLVDEYVRRREWGICLLVVCSRRPRIARLTFTPLLSAFPVDIAACGSCPSCNGYVGSLM